MEGEQPVNLIHFDLPEKQVNAMLMVSCVGAILGATNDLRAIHPDIPQLFHAAMFSMLKGYQESGVLNEKNQGQMEFLVQMFQQLVEE